MPARASRSAPETNPRTSKSATSAQATSLVVNGDFEQLLVPGASREFGSRFPSQQVTGWTTNGYNFVFTPGAPTRRANMAGYNCGARATVLATACPRLALRAEISLEWTALTLSDRSHRRSMAWFRAARLPFRFTGGCPAIWLQRCDHGAIRSEPRQPKSIYSDHQQPEPRV